MPRCALCHVSFRRLQGHNGAPVVSAQVCTNCNQTIIIPRRLVLFAQQEEARRLTRAHASQGFAAHISDRGEWTFTLQPAPAGLMEDLVTIELGGRTFTLVRQAQELVVTVSVCQWEADTWRVGAATVPALPTRIVGNRVCRHCGLTGEQWLGARLGAPTESGP